MPNANPIDIAIASFVNKDLKSCASTTAMSACECTNPQLRHTMAQISQDAIRRQEQLAHMASQKGWYVAPKAHLDTFQQLMPQLQAATQGLAVGAGVVGAQVQGAIPGAQAHGSVPGTQATGSVTAPRIM